MQTHSKERHPVFWAILLVAALLIRLAAFGFESGDFIQFLHPWTEALRGQSIAAGIANYAGDYNVTYTYILALVSRLPVRDLYAIKAVSVAFDFLLAFAASRLAASGLTGERRQRFALGGAAAVLFAPTVWMNGALWAQCDAIYTFFAVMAVVLLLREKTAWAFFCWGISFAFKLQAVFVLPVFVFVWFGWQRYRLRCALAAPAAIAAMTLPALLCGRPLRKILGVYLTQTTEYQKLALHFPSMYNLFGTPSETAAGILSKLGVLLTGLVLFLMLLLVIRARKTAVWNAETVLLLTLWGITAATLFLPHMHERYLFTGDIVSILYCLRAKQHIGIAAGISLLSTLSYLPFLFNVQWVNFALLTLAYIALFCRIGAVTVREALRVPLLRKKTRSAG